MTLSLVSVMNGIMLILESVNLHDAMRNTTDLPISGSRISRTDALPVQLIEFFDVILI